MWVCGFAGYVVMWMASLVCGWFSGWMWESVCGFAGLVSGVVIAWFVGWILSG